MQIQKVIEELGYKRSEAKVYLAALSLGEAHISDIAIKAKLPRSSVQVIVDRLHKNGLMTFYVRRRYKYWTAENPQHLLSILKEREEDVTQAMPRLEALRHIETGKPKIKIFEGIDEIKSIYADMLETRQHIRGIVPWDDWVKLVGMDYMQDFIGKRVRRFLRIQLLTPRTAISEEVHTRDAHELRETRFVDPSYEINTTTFIYGAKVAIISLNKKYPTCILIDDPDVRDTFNVFFNVFWKQRRP